VRRTRLSINITDQLEAVIADLCARVPAFAHINPRQLLLCLARARSSGTGGTYAKIVPMRYPDGSPVKTISGRHYALPQIPSPHGDILYLIYLYVPRFFEQPFERRVLTLVHELYHIAPHFDGTIRRVSGRAHGTSRAVFNANLQPLVDAYLTSQPSADLHLLRCDIRELSRQAALTGRSLPLPKAVRVG